MKTPARATSIPKRGFSVKESAIYLGVSQWTVRKLIAAGRLPHCFAGEPFDPYRFTRGKRSKGKIVILKETLDELLDNMHQYGALPDLESPNPLKLASGGQAPV